MSNGSSTDDTPLPCRPPLEIVELDDQWVLEVYREGRRDGETFSTHDSQIDAMRAGKTRMDDGTHPCLLRWDAENIVGNIYWNPLFRQVNVEYDEMMERWVVVPDAGHYLFHTAVDRRQACELGQTVKREYDFRHLVIYTDSGHEQREIDHRFVRQSLGDSGVRFDRSKLQADTDPSEPEPDDPSGVQPGTTPASALAAAVPDIAQVDVIDVSGPIHRYRAAWSDERDARIDVLPAGHSRDGAAVERFTDAVERWKTVSRDDRVTTVLDSGIGPSPWVAFPVRAGSLAERVDDLPLAARLNVIDSIAGALDAAGRLGVTPRGVDPETIRLTSTEGEWRATLADWGLRRGVTAAVLEQPVTPYTAPEQLAGGVASTTGVYQLAAVAYWLVTDVEPFADAGNRKRAIREGRYTAASRYGGVPTGTDEVLSRAMALDPADRYSQATTFSVHLREQLR